MPIITFFNDNLPADFSFSWQKFIDSNLSPTIRKEFKSYNDIFNFVPPWINLEIKLRQSGKFSKKQVQSTILDVEQFLVTIFLQENRTIYSNNITEKIILITPLTSIGNLKIEKSNIITFNPATIGRRQDDPYILEHASKLAGVELSPRVRLLISEQNPILIKGKITTKTTIIHGNLKKLI